MAKEKKFVEEITSMEVDFAQWYTDVVKKAELIDYSSVKGLVILRPYAYAIWENIQKELDSKFKQTGHENVYMPLLIPESLLQKEKDHIEGFAPEVAWVTHGGSEQLQERLCIRPTSRHYSANTTSISSTHIATSLNYTTSGARYCAGKKHASFLRHREFLWQEATYPP